MATFIKNTKGLFIPNKATTPTERDNYGTDMRAIETWANTTPFVRRIVAGTDVTTSPATGFPNQTGDVTVNATGGAGSVPLVAGFKVRTTVAGSTVTSKWGDVSFATLHTGTGTGAVFTFSLHTGGVVVAVAPTPSVWVVIATFQLFMRFKTGASVAPGVISPGGWAYQQRVHTGVANTPTSPGGSGLIFPNAMQIVTATPSSVEVGMFDLDSFSLPHSGAGSMTFAPFTIFTTGLTLPFATTFTLTLNTPTMTVQVLAWT